MLTMPVAKLPECGHRRHCGGQNLRQPSTECIDPCKQLGSWQSLCNVHYVHAAHAMWYECLDGNQKCRASTGQSCPRICEAVVYSWWLWKCHFQQFYHQKPPVPNWHQAWWKWGIHRQIVEAGRSMIATNWLYQFRIGRSGVHDRLLSKHAMWDCQSWQSATLEIGAGPGSLGWSNRLVNCQ